MKFAARLNIRYVYVGWILFWSIPTCLQYALDIGQRVTSYNLSYVSKWQFIIAVILVIIKQKHLNKHIKFSKKKSILIMPVFFSQSFSLLLGAIRQFQYQ